MVMEGIFRLTIYWLKAQKICILVCFFAISNCQVTLHMIITLHLFFSCLVSSQEFSLKYGTSYREIFPTLQSLHLLINQHFYFDTTKKSQILFKGTWRRLPNLIYLPYSEVSLSHDESFSVIPITAHCAFCLLSDSKFWIITIPIPPEIKLSRRAKCRWEDNLK